MMKGALHVHSTYSDGEFTLPELRSAYSDLGCQFICITDHAEAFDQEKLRRYHEECAALSDQGFRFVAGLEYSCERRMHILGYGAKSLLGTVDPQNVIAGIRDLGAISVIAHPKDEALPWIESFDTLPDGIEAWNSKYDGRYAPRAQVFHTLSRLQERKPQMLAFYGQDLHWRKQYRGLLNIMVECPHLSEDGILTALRRGDYVGTTSNLELPSSGQMPVELLARFAAIHGRSRRLRSFASEVKKALDSLGISVPGALKAHLRRIF